MTVVLGHRRGSMAAGNPLEEVAELVIEVGSLQLTVRQTLKDKPALTDAKISYANIVSIFEHPTLQISASHPSINHLPEEGTHTLNGKVTTSTP